MGIPNGKYDIELIRRTKELIETYKGKYNITLLMNCLLSLVVLPQQYNSRKKNLNFMNQELDKIDEMKPLLNSPNFFFDKRNFNNDLKNILNRIRNGISHQHIESMSENNAWVGVTIEDYDRSGKLGLHLELSIKELKTFALFIADEYLNEVNK